MDNPIISFIIPVYNTARWLRDCVDSVLDQAVPSGQIEIILVNDGSTDESPAICDALAEAFANIRVIHKKNGGLSDARNAGIALAKGRYLTFLDSDDLIAPDSLAGVLTFLDRNNDPRPQLVFLEISDLLPDGRIGDYGLHFQRDRLQNRSKEEVLSYLGALPKNPITACGKLIDRQLMAKNKYQFDPGWRSGEDLDFSLGLFMLCRRFDCCGGDFYRYRRIREGSITNTTDLRKLNETLSIMEKWIRLAEDPYRPWKESIFAFLSYTYIVVLGVFRRASDPSPLPADRGTRGVADAHSAPHTPSTPHTPSAPKPNACRESTWRRICEMKFLLSYGAGKKTRMISILSRIAGIRLTSIILGRYLQWR